MTSTARQPAWLRPAPTGGGEIGAKSPIQGTIAGRPLRRATTLPFDWGRLASSAIPYSGVGLGHAEAL